VRQIHRLVIRYPHKILMSDNATKFGSPWFENEGVLRLRPQAWRGGANTSTRFGALGARDKDSGEIKFSPQPWRGVEPGYATQFGSQAYDETNGTLRTRPQPWRQRRATTGPVEDSGSEDAPACTPAFYIYVIAGSGADGWTPYLKEGANPTCYYGNPTQGALSLGGGGSGTFNPPDCTGGGLAYVDGNYTASTSFSAWENQSTACAPPSAIGGFAYVENTGTCEIDVNGTILAGGEFTIISPIADAGYGTGDQSAYGAGTSIIVTIL